jgi:hypothetical protein
LVVEEVVGHIIASVAKDAAAIRSQCRIPVPEDDGVGKFPERRGERGKKRRWHDKPVLVHREVMMNTVKEEMQGEANSVVWKMPVIVSKK